MIGDNRLGLNEPISRRDFLNGALLAGAGLLLHGEAPTISPADGFNGYGGIGDYRHSNGNTWDVLSAGHGMRDGAFERRIAGGPTPRPCLIRRPLHFSVEVVAFRRGAQELFEDGGINGVVHIRPGRRVELDVQLAGTGVVADGRDRG